MNNTDIIFTIVCKNKKIHIDRQGVFILLCNYMDPATALSMLYLVVKDRNHYAFNWSVTKNSIYLYRLIKTGLNPEQYTSVILSRLIRYKLGNIDEICFICNDDIDEVFSILNTLRIQHSTSLNLSHCDGHHRGNYFVELKVTVLLGKALDINYNAYYTRYAHCAFDLCQFIHNERIDWEDKGTIFKEVTGLTNDVSIDYLTCEKIALYNNIVETVDKLHNDTIEGAV